MTNEELVELIQSGENVTDNMEQLYNQNHGMIYKMARRYTWGGTHGRSDAGGLYHTV